MSGAPGLGGSDPHWLGATLLGEGALLGEGVAARPSAAGIDYDRLRQREPILWFDDACLFESELDDNGASTLSVRVRVMPSCFFVLQRFVLRVDSVLLRIVDTRVYHRLGAGALVVERTWREESFASLEKRTGQRSGSKFYTELGGALVEGMPLKGKDVVELELLEG